LNRNGETPRILIADDSLDRATLRASRHAPTEAGGILIGFRHDSDVHVVSMPTVPGAMASRHRFVMNEQEREKALSEGLGDAPEDTPLGYVGTWHTHPAPSGISWIDRRTLRKQARQSSDVVALVVLVREPSDWRPHGRVAGPGRQSSRGAEVLAWSAVQPTPSGNGNPDGAVRDGST
jgi:integrative and conjugative element protein (TIGR02256 family)